MGLIIALAFAFGCAAVASSKGRNTVGWFVFGFFFNVIALIIAAVVPDLKKEEQRHRQTNVGQSRIKEQVRQERMRREAFENHTLARLDAHDANAGIDTRAIAPPPLPPQLAAAADPKWYYESGGKSCGPVPETELRALLEDGSLQDDTLVWCEGMHDWAPARTIGELV
ncbi:MAG: DUF4339 domain-containing protein [Planctomycetota bacterium]